MGLSGPFIGRMYDKIGPRPLTVTGSALMVLCLWQFAMMNASTPIWYVTVIQTVLNFSLALLFTPAFTNGLNPLPPQLYSHGSAFWARSSRWPARPEPRCSWRCSRRGPPCTVICWTARGSRS